MDVDKLLAVTDIYAHASCPDGLASAMISVMAFASVGLRPKVRFLQYGTEKMTKLEPRPNQLFVDITPPVDRWQEWTSVAPVVLDHHATAKAATEGLSGVYGGPEQSGATLAFEHVFRPLAALAKDTSQSASRVREFANLAAIRDTWQDNDVDWMLATGMAHELMQNNPYDLVDQARDGSLNFDALWAAAVRASGGIESKCKKLTEHAHFEQVILAGAPLLTGTFNCTDKLISDAANMLLRHGCDIAIAYFMLVEDGGPKISVSLRTNGEISARALAEHRGGGGHHRAAGFRIDDALHVSLDDIVRSVTGALRSISETVQLEERRERRTAEQVVESIRAIRQVRRS